MSQKKISIRSCWFLVTLGHLLTVNIGSITAFDGTAQAANSSGSAYSVDNDNYEDMTYEQMVSELNRKKKLLTHSMESTTSDSASVQSHIGLAYVNSFTTLRVGAGQFQRYQNGMQISLGTDLSDPQWFGEACIRNFGVAAHGNEELNLKELLLKIGHTSDLHGPWAYFLTTGYSNRFLRFVDGDSHQDIHDTTPSWVGSFGVKSRISRGLSFSFELLGRTALISTTSDTGSLDFAFRLDTSL